MLQKRSLLILPLVAKEYYRGYDKGSNQDKQKNGKPKKAVTKEVIRSGRFSKAEYFIVKHHASKSGVKITAYIRHMALDGKIEPVLIYN